MKSLSVVALFAVLAASAAAHECKIVHCDASDASPVCGSDGKTYSSKCFLEFAKCEKPHLKMVHAHPCDSTMVHIRIKANGQGVGDSGGHGKGKDGTKADDCEKPCTREMEPVCGSDGNTYNNHCLFEIGQCQNKNLVMVKKDGPCPTHDDCDKPCSRELDQICGSDGKTYNNHCLFENGQCKNVSLTIAKEDGPCPDKLQARSRPLA